MAQWIVILAGLYGAAGALFAAWFVTRGVGAVDAGARGAPALFRVLIFPGVAALWPVMLRAWLAARTREGHA